MRLGTDTQTDTQTRVTTIHFSWSSTHAKYNKINNKLECGPMPNVMVTLPNIGVALCSTPQSLADAQY